MNFDPNDLTNLISVIFKISMAFFCLLHALFVLYVARQIINMKDLLSTMRRKPLIIFAFIHAIILLALLLYFCFLPQF
jgi:hypothetical protein